VEIGKQLLMTRGALTTSPSPTTWRNILRSFPPCLRACFSAGRAQCMHLATPLSAILSAVIFNA